MNHDLQHKPYQPAHHYQVDRYSFDYTRLLNVNSRGRTFQHMPYTNEQKLLVELVVNGYSQALLLVVCFLRFELNGVANCVLILVIQPHVVCTIVLYLLPLDRYGYDQYVIFYQGCLLYRLAYFQPNYEYLQHHLVKLLVDLTALQ